MIHSAYSYSTCFFKINFYWSVVGLLCVSFCCMAKWISFFIYMYHHFFRFFFHLGHYSVLSSFPCVIYSRFCCVCVRSHSRVQLFVTPRTVAHQGPLSVEFSRQGYWNGLPFPPSGNLPNPGIEPESPAVSRWVLYWWTTILQYKIKS